MTPAYFSLLASIGTAIDYVNLNGGWTVFGWYKRGVANNKTLTDASVLIKDKEDAKVDSGDLSIHIVH
eukprot:6597531-Ditylum_brightwellii.AAC.1